MGNPNRDEKTGRLSSGSSGAAAVGDHQAVSPSAMTRNVPGHGNLPRSKVVAMHEHRQRRHIERRRRRRIGRHIERRRSRWPTFSGGSRQDHPQQGNR